VSDAPHNEVEARSRELTICGRRSGDLLYPAASETHASRDRYSIRFIGFDQKSTAATAAGRVPLIGDVVAV